jgi:hypothetical protein
MELFVFGLVALGVLYVVYVSYKPKKKEVPQATIVPSNPVMLTPASQVVTVAKTAKAPAAKKPVVKKPAVKKATTRKPKAK